MLWCHYLRAVFLLTSSLKTLLDLETLSFPATTFQFGAFNQNFTGKRFAACDFQKQIKGLKEKFHIFYLLRGRPSSVGVRSLFPSWRSFNWCPISWWLYSSLFSRSSAQVNYSHNPYWFSTVGHSSVTSMVVALLQIVGSFLPTM